MHKITGVPGVGTAKLRNQISPRPIRSEELTRHPNLNAQAPSEAGANRRRQRSQNEKTDKDQNKFAQRLEASESCRRDLQN